MSVYKPSPKAIRKNSFKESQPDKLRLIFRTDSSALLYSTDGYVIQSDLYYRRPDSHVELTTDLIPDELKIDKRENQHVSDHEIDMFGINLKIDE